MDINSVIDRLFKDQPKFHYAKPTEDSVAQNTLRRYGFLVEEGPVSWNVPRRLLEYMAATFKEGQLSLETGAGYTTVLFAAASKHHWCITPFEREVELIRSYLQELGLSVANVTFLIEPSDLALPKLVFAGRIDYAFVDGCHGYPFPALDWHYIDRHLKIGGIIGFDNTEIRAVANHCRFLEENGEYTLVCSLSFPGTMYGANFYRKLCDQEREWPFQPYNRLITPYHSGSRPSLRHRVVPLAKKLLKFLKY